MAVATKLLVYTLISRRLNCCNSLQLRSAVACYQIDIECCSSPYHQKQKVAAHYSNALQPTLVSTQMYSSYRQLNRNRKIQFNSQKGTRSKTCIHDGPNDKGATLNQRLVQSYRVRVRVNVRVYVNIGLQAIVMTCHNNSLSPMQNRAIMQFSVPNATCSLVSL